ncbi:ZYRO0G15620p [Zygosaccharomyces rouxii]|uniref:ZYRO0G15620p n=1 Tax=Zygosaccharomyces rouxii (strain ATCC 2623 / CBS 732 / NBRC 1130 / NCYC 568 / NRRL Y-229) TaxID=559307 RepID=C5E0U2_ZYGRC|nr:uncharacterized protein ZYRO0G15620g [Zygosaccharomyces rouxii]KAH9202719.1 Dbl homology domain-containing protein [Zygosaccharomyces rouxii]CAR29726.1 ZYRO0G15620p [Zygosaccharomyces rouxii]
MFRKSELYSEFCHHPSDAMSPIRDYDNDYFHKNDKKLPKVQLHKYGPGYSYNENSKRSNHSSKRPASLHLDIEGPSAKKQFSPINIARFSDAIKIKETPVEPESFTNSENAKFFSVVKSLYMSENEYGKLIDACNLVYRNVLHENKTYRHKLLEQRSNEEFLLFGNLETISSISRLFVTALKRIILAGNNTGEIDDDIWEQISTNSSLQKQILSEFDIGKAFNTNFLRIKSTYLSYCGSHRKQMELFGTMRSKNPHLFYRWYEHCYEASGNLKLEDILNKPVQRIAEWSAFLETIISLAPKILEKDFCASIEKAYDEYSSFSSYIENETAEFNCNANYDFSLTPIEIIQSYDSDKVKDFKPQLGVLSMISESQSSQNRESSQTLSLPRTEDSSGSDVHLRASNGNDVHLRTSNGTNSVFSASSSRYSGDTAAAQSLEPLQRQKFLSMVSQVCGDSQHTLADHISTFKKLHKGLIHLKAALSNDDMLSIIDINLKHTDLWRRVVEFENINPSQNVGAEQPILVSSMCSAYTEKLKRQREEATMMKLTFFEGSVKRPLKTMLKYCEAVRARLKDLNSLKKDYMVFLRQKTSHTHDFKRDILAKHFEQMHRKMAQDLPKFLELLHETLKYLTLNYHKVMLKYLEISADGDDFLIKDLEQLGKLKRDVGKNYDILQTYSTARYCAKRLVRENWEFDQDLTCSRVLRKLFEL